MSATLTQQWHGVCIEVNHPRTPSRTSGCSPSSSRPSVVKGSVTTDRISATGWNPQITGPFGSRSRQNNASMRRT